VLHPSAPRRDVAKHMASTTARLQPQERIRLIKTQRGVIRSVPAPRSAPFELFLCRTPLENWRFSIRACGYQRQPSPAACQKFYAVSLPRVSLLTPIAVLPSSKLILRKISRYQQLKLGYIGGADPHSQRGERSVREATCQEQARGSTG
jgi:hypothetical protein